MAAVCTLEKTVWQCRACLRALPTQPPCCPCLREHARQQGPTQPPYAAHLHKLHQEIAVVANDLSRRLLLALSVLRRSSHHLQRRTEQGKASRLSSSAGGSRVHATRRQQASVLPLENGLMQARELCAMPAAGAAARSRACSLPALAAAACRCQPLRGQARVRAAPPAAACLPGRASRTLLCAREARITRFEAIKAGRMLALALFFSPAPAPLAKPANGLTPAPGRRLSGRSETSASSPIALSLCCSPGGIGDALQCAGPCHAPLPHATAGSTAMSSSANAGSKEPLRRLQASVRSNGRGQLAVAASPAPWGQAWLPCRAARLAPPGTGRMHSPALVHILLPDAMSHVTCNASRATSRAPPRCTRLRQCRACAAAHRMHRCCLTLMPHFFLALLPNSEWKSSYKW